MAVNAGPIPGENYTSDTKNYPWRQPPEYTDLNDALDYLAKYITKFDTANGILTMVELGFPVYKIVGMLLTMGVGEGKWTIDYTLLLAGPLCRMIELMCIGFGIDYDLGLEDDPDDFETSKSILNEQKLRTPSNYKLIEENLPEIKEAAEEQGGDASDEGNEADLQSQGFMQMQQGQGAMTSGPQTQGNKEEK